MSWTHLSSKIVSIRKQHQCLLCLDVLRPPAKMEYVTGIYEGNFQSTYTCEICTAYMTPERWRECGNEVQEGHCLECDDYKEFRKQKLTSSPQT